MMAAHPRELGPGVFRIHSSGREVLSGDGMALEAFEVGEYPAALLRVPIRQRELPPVRNASVPMQLLHAEPV
jgi:hypothetical protein